jgi:hypothetical protein
MAHIPLGAPALVKTAADCVLPQKINDFAFTERSDTVETDSEKMIGSILITKDKGDCSYGKSERKELFSSFCHINNIQQNKK